MKNYSQNDEQDVILNYFKGRVGRFLDVGAYDGVTFSNTMGLIQSGWGGVMVEPSPFNLVKLIESVRPYSFSNDIQIIAAACAPSQGLVDLSIDETEHRGWAVSIVPTYEGIQRKIPVTFKVPTIRPEELFDGGNRYQFINIDAEGMDMEIIKAIPSECWVGCEMVCAEPGHGRDLMKRFFADQLGFKIVHETKENLIAVVK